MYWRLNEKGVKRPSRKASKSKSEPKGVTVLPGDYKLVLNYKGNKDSTMITVKYDPRIPISNDVLQSKYDLQKEIETKFDLAYRSTKQLKESKKIAQDYKNQAKNIDKKKYKDFIKKSDSIIKQIDVLLNDILGKEDKRQGITATKEPTNISYLNTANWYVGSLQEKPGKTEKQLVKNAYDKLDGVILDINKFYETDWSEYRKRVESLNLSSFKDYKELK